MAKGGAVGGKKGKAIVIPAAEKGLNGASLLNIPLPPDFKASNIPLYVIP